MKILIIPDYGCDIYIKRLKFFFEKRKIEVLGVSSSFFSLFFYSLYFKPDIIYLHWTSPFIIGRNIFFSIVKSIIFLFEILFFKFILNVKIVWTVHNLVNHEKIFWKLERFINKILYLLCDKVTVHLNSQKEEFINFYGIRKDKIKIIREGNFNDIASLYDYNLSRKKLGIQPFELIFLFFGHIRRYKGIEFVIEAFKQIKRNDIVLYIIGKPYSEEYSTEITNLIKDNYNIKFIPCFVNDELLYEYISASDCVILPYREIFNSTVILLALSFKKAIITTKNAHFIEILGDDSLLIEYGNIVKLREIIENVKKNELNNVGDFYYVKIKDITWERQVDELIKLFYELINK
ncbi:MAG: glycosyltransferase [Candidatus Goldbacteria bacterium]|nr:glycosyltransferase [Candidatus Goldiibacteriota bacterium]